jgi:membrane-associated phospholipid phosphatase
MMKGPPAAPVTRYQSGILEFNSDLKKLRTHIIGCGAFLLVLALLTACVGDKRIAASVQSFVAGNAVLETSLQIVSAWGNYIFYALFFGIGLWGLVTGHRRFLYYAIAYLIVQIIAAVVLTRTLKLFVARPRPPGTSPGSATTAGNTESFPSGHTSDMACSASMLGYFLSSTYLRVLMYLLLALMAFSRVGLGEHYPFDVIAGAFLGLSVGYIVAHVFSSRFLATSAQPVPPEERGAPSA